MAEEIDRDIHWSVQLEDLIAKEGEKCRGLAWLHQRAELTISKKNNAIQIPVIVLSTLCGTASVSSTSLFGEANAQIASIVIGFVSITVGVLNTIQSYFGFSRKAEAHRIAHLHYSKLFSWIAVELALPREERLEPEVMLKQLREQMERLAETTPTLPESIIREFNAQFKKYDDVAKPMETNGLQKIVVFRTPLRSPQSDLKITIPISKDNDVGNAEGNIVRVE